MILCQSILHPLFLWFALSFFNPCTNPDELFLRGMPHLCEKMRRLTTKDLGKKKKIEQDGPTPDFYALSRENPLPESTPVPTTSMTPPAMAAGRTGSDLASADVELALLERRRADIFTRMNLLASTNGGAGGMNMNGMNGMNMNGINMNGMNGMNVGAAGMQQQLQQGGFGAGQLGSGAGQLGAGGQQAGGMQQQQNLMNNNSLMAAAALSLGNNGRPAGLDQAALQQQMLGGMGNFGQPFDAQSSALQRQLLEARLANSDMATILGLNNGGNMQMPNNGMNGMSGFMGMPPQH